jgi:DNA-binding XRE family transcriptional regulator
MTSPWEFENEEQRDRMLEPITPENCGEKLKLVRIVSGMSRRDLAGTLGVSESTIVRLETGSTKPTNEFMLKLAGLVAIGRAAYSRMSEKDRETLSEYIGAGGGVATGVGGSIAAVAAAGAVSGLSAAGITSGLAAIGGGTMLGGLAVVAALPVAAGLAGWGLIKGIKAICDANNLSCTEVDGRYEIRPASAVSNASEQKGGAQ